MNSKTRYILSLCGLAIVVATATVLFQRVRIQRAEAEVVRKQVALSSGFVNNKTHLEQVVIMQQQRLRKEPLSDQQVNVLATIVNGPPDSILKAKALTTARVFIQQGAMTDAQKALLTQAATKALTDPDFLTRASGAKFLGTTGDPKNASAILPLLNDSNDTVRRIASRTLDELKNPTSKK